MIHGENIERNTRGLSDIVDLSGDLNEIVERSGIRDGIVSVCVIGSTASVSTIEFEPALVADTQELLERLVPSDAPSRHSRTWGDDNGFSHMRSTLMGPGCCLPLVEGRLLLGTWQQVVLIDHDNRPRSRKVRVQIVGE